VLEDLSWKRGLIRAREFIFLSRRDASGSGGIVYFLRSPYQQATYSVLHEMHGWRLICEYKASGFAVEG
jgi:hypothetical protein